MAVAVVGFLLAGLRIWKTTLLKATIQALGHLRLAVIQGDPQTDLDAHRIAALGVRAHQITTGTVCHLDARMFSRAL
jgi:hydrogenase nickel incorporation protein HypB